MTATLDECVVAAARQWIGTPYHHQMAVRQAGCDCLGLIRGVYRDVVGVEPETPPPYSPDWGEVDPQERLLAAATRHLQHRAHDDWRAGHVIVLRWRQGMAAKHAAILTEQDRMIHAYDGVGVVEVTFADHWKRRVAGVFAFPERR